MTRNFHYGCVSPLGKSEFPITIGIIRSDSPCLNFLSVHSYSSHNLHGMYTSSTAAANYALPTVLAGCLQSSYILTCPADAHATTPFVLNKPSRSGRAHRDHHLHLVTLGAHRSRARRLMPAESKNEPGKPVQLRNSFRQFTTGSFSVSISWSVYVF
uniref:Uncharacterized protein n=2 Tax=Aegilops tauschii subsp. strangulata TaxID=200361 RepID=A0A453DM31_AEGTS